MLLSNKRVISFEFNLFDIDFLRDDRQKPLTKRSDALNEVEESKSRSIWEDLGWVEIEFINDFALFIN